MPRYFFNTADDGHLQDTEGTLLPDHRAARTEAIRFMGELLADQPELLQDDQEFWIEVTDDKQMLVFAITSLGTNAPAA